MFAEFEDLDRHLAVSTEGDRGAVHDLQILFQHGIIAYLPIFLGLGIFLRVAVIDAVGIGRFHEQIALELQCAKRSRHVGREIRISGTTRTDHNSPLLQMSAGSTLDVGLGHGGDIDGAANSSVASTLLNRRHQRHGVDNSRHHAHIVRRNAINVRLSRVAIPPDIAGAHDHRHFIVFLPQGNNLARQIAKNREINAGILMSEERFTGELEQNSFHTKEDWGYHQITIPNNKLQMVIQGLP